MRKRWIALVLVAALLCLPVSAAFAETTDSTPANETVTGLQEKDGKLYYYDASGALVKDRIAMQITTDGVTGYYNIDAAGVATKLEGNEELAAKRLIALKAVPTSLTAKNRLAALKKAFLWSAKLKYKNNTKKLSASKALEYYGEYGFTMKRGDCNTKATTFYWMAKVLGYDNAKVIRGYVPRAKKGKKYSKFRAHAWVQIKFGKKKYGFDPEFNRSSDAKKLRKKNKYVGFKFRYRQKGTYAYHNSKKKLIKK